MGISKECSMERPIECSIECSLGFQVSCPLGSPTLDECMQVHKLTNEHVCRRVCRRVYGHVCRYSCTHVDRHVYAEVLRHDECMQEYDCPGNLLGMRWTRWKFVKHASQEIHRAYAVIVQKRGGESGRDDALQKDQSVQYSRRLTFLTTQA